MMLDLQKLKADLSCIDAASELGVKMRAKGNAYEAICPAHNDRHFGSCYIYDTHWKCFACGAGGDVFSLIQAVNNSTEAEAFEEAAVLTGRPDAYRINSKVHREEVEKFEDFPLTAEEISLLKLKKSVILNNIKYVDYEKEGSLETIYEEDDKMFGHGQKVKASLLDFWASDPEGFMFLVDSKCDEMIEYLSSIVDSEALTRLNLANDTLYALNIQLKQYIIKCKLIKKKIAA